jgi:hypothetical protein
MKTIDKTTLNLIADTISQNLNSRAVMKKSSKDLCNLMQQKLG